VRQSTLALLSQEGVFPGIYYGFPEDTAAEVREEFPDIQIVWRAPARRMEAWACGEQGALVCLDNDVQPWQCAKLVQQIRENRRAAEDYRYGDIAKRIHAQQERDKNDKLEATLSAMDPEREARDALQAFGRRIAPVAVPGNLPAN